jgi:hypothetical protein
MKTTIKNDREAVAVGLALGIIAPNAWKSEKALQLTALLAAKLTPAEMEQAKEDALRLSQAWESQADYSNN